MVWVSFWFWEQVLGGSLGFVGGHFWVLRWFRRFSCWRPLCYQVVSPHDSKWFPPKRDSKSPMKPASGKLALMGLQPTGALWAPFAGAQSPSLHVRGRSSLATLGCTWLSKGPIGSWPLPLAISDPSLVHFLGPGPRKWSFTTILRLYNGTHEHEHMGLFGGFLPRWLTCPSS